MPCSNCGASLERGERDAHVCDRERWLDYRVFQLRDEVEAFEGELAGFLDSVAGRFELFYAARARRRGRRPVG